jgi:hypothetical protein
MTRRIDAALTRIQRAQDHIQAEISRWRDPNSMFSRGLSNEGFNGGYLEALRDVEAVLRGNPPGQRFPEAWREPHPQQKTK